MSVFDWRQAFMDLEKQRARGGGDTNEENKAPVPYLTIIEQTGMVVISFSSDMHIVPKLSMINNGTVLIHGEEQPVFKV